ncbi:DUF504 domain-containing protein [Candidatus Woesearchaeota archaeon]|nr:DUF504 domain-containing protein [Candidatus Woesearchaeota archaeon]
MPMRESDKHFLWSLYYAVGIILIWKGIWEGIGSLPLLELPFVSLFVGLVMLTFSGLLMREFDPLGGLEKGVQNMLHGIHHHPQKEEFTISYFDNKKNKEVKIEAHKLKLIEKNVLSFHDKGKEVFIPMHRVRRIHRKGKEVWRL